MVVIVVEKQNYDLMACLVVGRLNWFDFFIECFVLYPGKNTNVYRELKLMLSIFMMEIELSWSFYQRV